MKLATFRSSSTTMIRIAFAALLRVSAVVASGELAARRGGVRLERVGVAARQLYEADPGLAVAHHDGQQRGRGRLRDSETAATSAGVTVPTCSRQFRISLSSAVHQSVMPLLEGRRRRRSRAPLGTIGRRDETRMRGA